MVKRERVGLMLLRCVRVAVLLGAVLAARSQKAPAPARPCAGCIRIRVGLPRIVRGPSLEIADNHFTEIHLPDGRFRGFDAHGSTRAIDGAHPWDMGATGRVVLVPGKAGAFDACGKWLNYAEVFGKTTLGLIHDETACHYQNNGETHKSMSIASSADFGLTWKDMGQVITGSDPPVAGHESGEGDCTAVDGRDGFLYAYCIRSRNRDLIAARAPIDQPGPGNWKKFLAGKWDSPGLGGDATRLGSGSGVSVARWATTGELVFTGWTAGGLGLSFSADHTTLVPLPEPILPLDVAGSGAVASPDRLLYMVLLDAATGSNQLSDHWNLVYAFWPANEARDQKYLVFRDIEVSVQAKPDAAPVGVLLARWVNAATHDRWSTTAPVPGNYAAYALERQSGYLLPAAPSVPSVELEDCVMQRPGFIRHLLAEKGFCEAHQYTKLRTAGWVYQMAQPETTPLYRCYNAKDQSHFASDKADCEGLGEAERLLGYAVGR